MQSFVVPKNRRPKFDLKLKIIDLNNVPLVSGSSFIKWHLPSSTAAEHRGKTSKCNIKDHKVTYDYEKAIPVRLVIGKDGQLQETWVHFEVIQEYQSGGRDERIALGGVKLNLAEYVDPSQSGMTEHEGEGILRRYLMQDSKINSTLKIEISMKQVEGDRNFSAPSLRSAPVFGGIAGIMSHEAAEAEDNGHMPSLSSKSREVGELQDMYRRILVASWAAQPGELKADECIEDIFAGGDGWGSHLRGTGRKNASRGQVQNQRRGSDDTRSTTDEDMMRKSSSNSLSSMFGKHKFRPAKHHSRQPSLNNGRGEREQHNHDNHDHHNGHHQNHHRHGSADLKQGAVSGRASLEHQVRSIGKASKHGKRRPHNHEVDEFSNEWRDSLVSWNIRQPAAG